MQASLGGNRRPIDDFHARESVRLQQVLQRFRVDRLDVRQVPEIALEKRDPTRRIDRLEHDPAAWANLVEGQTEEGFVNRILAPELGMYGVFADAHRITTGRRHGRAFRGGLVRYDHLANDLLLWMKQDQNQDEQNKDQKSKDEQQQKEQQEQQQNQQGQKPEDQQSQQQDKQKDQQQASKPEDKQDQKEQGQNASKSDDKTGEQDREPEAGQPQSAMMRMTPEQAIRLLESFKADEKNLPFRPVLKTNRQDRIFKDW